MAYTYEAEVLAQQLAQLGRDLVTEVAVLGGCEEDAVEAEGDYRKLVEEHEDAVAQAFLAAGGSVEQRKAQARLGCVPSRLAAQDACLEWNRCKARLRTQQASLQALHRRVEVGRSLLSREKALVSLAGVGEV